MALETKSAYQEHLLQSLNEVIIEQQQQLEHLTKMMTQMTAYVHDLGEQSGEVSEDCPPPHY